jgi:hypothetical protein
MRIDRKFLAPGLAVAGAFSVLAAGCGKQQ